jgi:hypothetical protein
MGFFDGRLAAGVARVLAAGAAGARWRDGAAAGGVWRLHSAAGGGAAACGRSGAGKPRKAAAIASASIGESCPAPFETASAFAGGAGVF